MKTIRSNKKGFGIHSPFVYQLVTEVLFPYAEFYVFDKINQLKTGTKEKEQLESLFRLLNYFQPDKVICVGDIPLEELKILKRSVHNAEFILNDFSGHKDNFQQLLKSCSFIIFEKYPVFEIERPETNAVWFIKKTNSGKDSGQISQPLRSGYGIVTLTLKYAEIVIFDKRFPDQNYVIK